MRESVSCGDIIHNMKNGSEDWAMTWPAEETDDYAMLQMPSIS